MTDRVEMESAVRSEVASPARADEHNPPVGALPTVTRRGILAGGAATLAAMALPRAA